MSCTSINNSLLGNRRGSAILLVVSVGALVTMLVFSWVAFSAGRSLRAAGKQNQYHARYAAESVISQAVYERRTNPDTSLLRKKDTSLIINTPDTLLKPDDPLTYTDTAHESSATATVSEEGSYFRVKADGSAGKARVLIDALFGTLLPDEFKYALVLSAPNTPLEIKRGRIIGDAKLATAPTGTIEGKCETGTTSATLPAIDEGAFTREITKFNETMQSIDSNQTVLVSAAIFNEQNPLAFSKNPAVFVNGNVLIEYRTRTRQGLLKGPGTLIVTGNVQISGTTELENMSVLALGKIQCFDNVRLRAVTLYSKEYIALGDQARVSGTLYAEEKIVLVKNAAVEEPAFACTFGDTGVVRLGGLQLSQQSRFTGAFFCKSSRLVSCIERDARLTGLFYSRSGLILDGTVIGCVVAEALREDVQSQKNILQGGIINRTLLPPDFIVPCAFTAKNPQFKVMSWTQRAQAGEGAP